MFRLKTQEGMFASRQVEHIMVLSPKFVYVCIRRLGWKSLLFLRGSVIVVMGKTYSFKKER
jgi:hypothetical protein